MVGIRNVIDVAHRFGIVSNIPAFLPVAIGAADLTLAEQVGAYSVFPNDGIRIAPHYIRRVEEADGLPMRQATPEVREVISLEIARKMMVLLRAVVEHGTGAAASTLNHALGGKTGTTNDYTDAWFIGFSPSITCGTWIGFDDRQSLGEKETGARAALPMWMAFMKVALADRPNEEFSRPNAPKKSIDLPLQPSLDAEPSAEPAPKDEEMDGTGGSGPPAGAAQPETPAPTVLPNDDSGPAKPAGKSPSPPPGPML
jgi:penicillin-binding protein 1A